MKILQVNTEDYFGGAARVAWNLHQSYRALGHSAWLLVGNKQQKDDSIIKFDNERCRGLWEKFWLNCSNYFLPLNGKLKGNWRLIQLFKEIGQIRFRLAYNSGREFFDYPGTRHILDIIPETPEIIHCHNLHGGYFDLRVLPQLSRDFPVVLSLHDLWLFSDFCANPYREKMAENRFNLRKKEIIFKKSRLHIVCPSMDLMRKAKNSILFPAIIQSEIIPNGVDLSLFSPGDRSKAREELGIPPEAHVLLCVNYWKKFSNLEAILSAVADKIPAKQIIFICLGKKRNMQKKANLEMWYIGYQNQLPVVAQYYRAADVYIHPLKEDIFPNAVLEAFACGIPVVASAVGGVPEQVDDGKCGFLVSPDDPKGMSLRITELLTNSNLAASFSENALKKANSCFGLEQQAKKYLNFYYQALEEFKGRHGKN